MFLVVGLNFTLLCVHNSGSKEPFKGDDIRSSCRGAVEMNLTGNNEVAGLVPGLAQWVKDPALQ